MLPGPYTTQTVKEVFIDGTVPQQVDNTKVPVDVDTDTNTLWTYDCPGTKVTKGFLDLSQIDAANPNFQKYDDIWIATAKKGVGTRGGPNNAPTNYFYETSFWIPPVQRGLGWGAPFAPTDSCTQSGTTPPSGWVPPTPSDAATPVPSDSQPALPATPPKVNPTPNTTPKPKHTPQPPPALLAPFGLLGLAGKFRPWRRRVTPGSPR
jgi:hypothetical protein